VLLWQVFFVVVVLCTYGRGGIGYALGAASMAT
jgi:hypothetical protein